MTCPRADFCECRIVYALINERISEVLEEYTLADLLDPSWVRQNDVPTADHLLKPGSFPESDAAEVVPVSKSEAPPQRATKHD